VSEHPSPEILVVLLEIGVAIPVVVLRPGRLDLRGGTQVTLGAARFPGADNAKRASDGGLRPKEEGGEARMNARQRGRAEVNACWRAWMVAVGTAVLLAVGGCAPGASTLTPSPSPGTGSATPSPAVTSSASPSDAATYPNLSRFSDPFDRFAYKSAYSDCLLIGVDGTADAFGGDPEDPSSVARAYAVTIFPEPEQPREATFRGCLDAFETGTP